MQKTTQLNTTITEYLATLDEVSKQSALTLCEIFTQATHEAPVLWRGNMIGFGTYHYKYASGHEGYAMKCGFAIRKTNITLYLYTETDSKNPNHQDQLLSQLGKIKHGKWCIYIKRLNDIDVEILKSMIRRTLETLDLAPTTMFVS